MTLPDWGSDPGTRAMVRVRCCEPQFVEADSGMGCGWEGNSAVVTQYGATEYEVKECPECGNPVEAE